MKRKIVNTILMYLSIFALSFIAVGNVKASPTCDYGEYPDNGDCSPCPAGYYCDGLTKTICSAGTYSNEGASVCKNCGYGYYCQGTANTAPTICPSDKPSTDTDTSTSISDCHANPNVTVTWSNTTFTYDGNEHAPTATVSVAGMTLNGLSLSYKDVGSYTYTVSCKSVTNGSCSNYNLENTTTSFVIEKKSLGVNVSCSNKKYDGTTSANCTFTPTGVVQGDEIRVTGTCTYSNKEIGAGKTITCNNFSLVNTSDSPNYTISSISTKTATASIMPENEEYHCYMCGNSQNARYVWGSDYTYKYGGSSSSCVQVENNSSTCNENLGGDPGSPGGPGITYTITADANGGKIKTPIATGWTMVSNSDDKKATKDVSSGSTYGTLPEVTKTDDTFKEWNTKADGTGTKVTSSTTANSSTTIYAIWESGALISVSSVTISPKPVEVEVGKNVYLTATVSPDNATNKEVNWSSSNPTIATVDNNGKVTGVKVGTVTVTATTVDGGKTDTVQVTVKAAGSGTITHNIYFDCTTNGGTGTMTPISVNYGSTVTLPETSCTKAGYSFKNWIGYDDEGTAIENGTYQDKSSIDYTFSTDITLKADYSGSSDTYLIRYDANGGKGTMNPTEAKSGVSGTLAANTFKYAGNTFAGWKAYYKDSSNNLKPLTNKDIDYKNKATFVDLFGPNGEEVTLYAQWKVKNPNTGIVAPTAIIGGLLLISAFGYYLVKKKNIVLE